MTKETKTEIVFAVIIVVIMVFLIIKLHTGPVQNEHSEYYPVSYATAPRMTGNDLADIQLLRYSDKSNL